MICPEHTKEPKILDTEVCGFPLTKAIFSATGDFCRQGLFLSPVFCGGRGGGGVKYEKDNERKEENAKEYGTRG